MRYRWMGLAVLLWTLPVAGANLLSNGDFAQGLAGWADFWTRTPGGNAAPDPDLTHDGHKVVRIVHTSTGDWSLAQSHEVPVVPGQIYDYQAWVRVAGEGDLTLGVVLRDGQHVVKDWSFGGQTTRATADWKLLRSRFIIPPESGTMLPRLIGSGPSTVWVAQATLQAAGTLAALRPGALPLRVQASNDVLAVAADTGDGTLTLTDRRSGRQWRQQVSAPVVVLAAQPTPRGFTLGLLDPAAMIKVQATVELDPQLPEVTVELSGGGAGGPDAPATAPADRTELVRPLAYPGSFSTTQGQFLILPVNEGIAYPVDDATLDPMYYHLYGGHGLCMGWYGITDGAAGVQTIVETPDDAAVNIPRRAGRLCLEPLWVPQRGALGTPRRLRYVLTPEGGYVAMCKRYRARAQQTGLFKTLADKRRENPAVDLLVGAVNVWCWEKESVAICRDMQARGIGHILWSNQGTPETLRGLNSLGVLTSRYDIYQDVMNPAEYPRLRWTHGDWSPAAWPKDLIVEADGQLARGWEVETKDDKMVPCGVMCDRQALAYARARIPAELVTHPYHCRFIDTTTAAPWHECYAPDHPMTRSDSRKFKMDLLKFISGDCGLVTGSETGHEAAVPYVHYFEGMLSLGPYRVPDAGRHMQELVTAVPPRVAKFQTGHYYRLPLWELVYHDCVVAQWYWGDYNNKLPALWDRRDLWNALYGTPPMFMFTRQLWQDQAERFVRSYQTATPVARATGYSEMLSHRWVNADHSVQETRFANGVVVTVNFGDQPANLEDGFVLAPLHDRVTGVAALP